MSAQAVASVLPDLDAVDSASQPDQVEVTTFAQSTSSVTSSTSAAEVGANFGLDGSGQTIAVIDTGIAFDHIALGGGFGENYRVVGGYDFAENDANPYDDGPLGFHGTHVAGIIGSTDLTYTGVAPGADLVALRVFDDSGATEIEWIEQSLQWVHDNLNTFENPITTVNLSLGTSPNEVYLEILNDELQQLEEDGVFISVAAGNSFGVSGAEQLAYPASSEFVVPVASYGSDGEISDFSQRAPNVLAAPGESIVSTVPDQLVFGTGNDSFLGTSGTSQAAPYVAGASAVLRQAYLSVGVSDIDQDLLYQQFVDTADSIYDSATNQSYYQINLSAALESVLNGTAKGSESSATDTPTNNNSTNNTSASLTQRANVSLNDGVLRITGTSGNDQITISADEDIQVLVNGVSQRYGLDEITSVIIDGGAGEDSVNVNLAGTDDLVQLLQNRVQVRNQDFSLTAFGIEEAVVDNGSGNDRLYVEGSKFDDVVKASGTSVLFSNEQFAASGGAFGTAYVVGEAGSDVIEFTGSDGDDRFAHNENREYFKSQQLELVARGFEEVVADGNGGSDLANLIGTSGNDTFEIDQDSATTRGGNADASIEGFARINVIGTQAGDKVTLSGSDGDDLLRASNGAAFLLGDSFSNHVKNASNLTITASTGNDTAYLAGTEGDDHFDQNGDVATLRNDQGEISVEGYDLVVAKGSGGNDTASFNGSDARERYFANEDTVQSTDRGGNITRAIGFEESSINGGGGNDIVGLRGGNNDETLRIGFDDVEFETTLQLLRLSNVENSTFSGGGGVDRVELGEVESLDLLNSLWGEGQAVSDNHTTTFIEVDEVEADAVDQAIAGYDLEAVDFEYNMVDKWVARDDQGH